MIKRYIFIWSCIIFLTGMHAVACAQDKPQVPTIDVTGKGVILAEPDTVTITFSVETSEKNAAEALKKNAVQTKALMDALKTTSDKAEITTSNFSLYPLYEKDSAIKERTGRPSPDGYRVNNSVIVKTPRIDTVGTLIDAAVDAGANRIGSLSFSRSDHDLLVKQAAAKALENAMDYGEELAKAAGLTIRRILYIQHAPGGTVYDYPVMAMAEERVPTPITPGQVSVESFVNVTFEVEQ
jgi:uncharacterized protein YggE